MNIYDEIRAERDRQDDQWGGASHDDSHLHADWKEYRKKFDERGDRASLVKIAALAVAEIEALDRGAGR